ncbi:MAG: hypothetical protein KDA05_11315, partial [Phycisphaerales bacterium]|nr:hypothetical protein [Phycisphaerales bacterium]
GNRPGNISQINEEYGLEPGDLLFNASDPREISFGTSGGGDAVFAGGFDGFFNTSGGVERLFFYGGVTPPTPAPAIPIGMGSANIYGPASPGANFPAYGGATVLRETTLNSIERIDDKDTYRIRATSTGTTEIRINTTQLTNGYMEYVANGLERVTDPMTGMPDGPADYEEFTTDDIGDRATYDSLLDATIRIYNADFEQIAFNDDSGVVRGDTQLDEVGTLDGPFNGNYMFYQRDPRVVFNVEEGEVYYIVVESGQKYIDGSAQNPDDRTYASSDGTASGTFVSEFIDWRTATGTYELLINSMPQSPLGPAGATQLAQGDDHIDFLDPLTNGLNVFDAVAKQATVLLVQPDGSINANAFTSASAGNYAGTITNRGTTRDTDLFTFVASSTGAATITLGRPTGSTLIPSFTITDFFGGQIASATASSLGTITGTFAVTQGERYFVAVGGGGGSQGRFTLQMSTPAPVDDHADINKFEDATVLDIQDFLGGGTANGIIENPGDTDVFTFQAFTTQDVTVTITPTSALDPILDIYEIQEDDVVGAPVVRRIASATFDTGYSTTFTMTRDRISTITSSRYDQYFMVVRGASPATDSGSYGIEFEFEPTDDHADEEQLANPATRALATTLLADTGTGRGDRDGEIEFFYDSDLFVYIAPAGGPAIFTADPVDASGLQPKLAVFDSSGTLIAQSDPFVTTPVTLGIDVQRGQPYYVVVRPSDFLFTNGVPNNASDPRLTGEYRISVAGPAVDDHANQGEFDRATVITLDSGTGDAAVGSSTQGAAGNPEIDPAIDTDLFQFSPRADGQVIVRVVSVGNSQLRPSMTIFRQDGP